MKFKSIVPYLLVGTMTGITSVNAQPDTIDEKNITSFHQFDAMIPTVVWRNFDLKIQDTDSCLDNKAKKLCDIYVKNMLRSHAKLNPLLGTRGYSAAVRRELPGAPVGYHCVWGQHTQLARALAETGDTLTIIPEGARTACLQFKQKMRDKYTGKDYTDCIFEGTVYPSDSVYQAAKNKFLTRNKVGANTPDSVKKQLITRFEKKNFNADNLNSGTILIVPRYHGSRNTFHAIMYLGRGSIQNGKFVPSNNGRHIYAGHNRETIGDLFNSYDMSNVFAADIKEIARFEYAKELKKIKSMNSQQLIQFLGEPALYCLYPREKLLSLAIAKYFNKDATEMNNWWDAPSFVKNQTKANQPQLLFAQLQQKAR